jgi:hypothetical protein
MATPAVQAQGGLGLLASHKKAAPAAPTVVVVPAAAPQPMVASTPTTLGGPLTVRTSTPGK